MGPQLPPYLMPRPASTTDAQTAAAFDQVLDGALAAGGDAWIDYAIEAPRWEFLCHVAEVRGFVLHGSGRPDIARFEPRKADDVRGFGDRRAVYAASDGIWPMFFAVVDGDHFPIRLRINSCVRVIGTGDTFYFFSISRPALDLAPWREGTVYVLPPATFEPDSILEVDGLRVQPTQVASSEPVVPLARIAVSPSDFPFLRRIRGHDDTVMASRMAANPDGFPWLDDR